MTCIMRSVCRFIAVFLFVSAAASCSSIAVKLPSVPNSNTRIVDSLSRYRLQPGDVLETRYPASLERDEQVVVAPDGRVSVAYAPNIIAAGRTLAEVTNEIASTAKIIDPGFVVSLRSSIGTRVYVTGEVTNPGEIVVDGPITALQAISRAGGFKETTAQTTQVVLMRRDESDKPKLYAMDLKAASDGDDPNQDAVLHPYDIIYVPRDRVGNVSLIFERIRQAIPFSFGFSYTGSPAVGF